MIRMMMMRMMMMMLMMMIMMRIVVSIMRTMMIIQYAGSSIIDSCGGSSKPSQNGALSHRLRLLGRAVLGG